MKANAILTGLVTLMLCIGCGGYEELETGTANINVSSTTVEQGTLVEFDASASSFDDLTWQVNGVDLAQCAGVALCAHRMNDVGVFEVSVIAAMEGGEGRAAVFIDVYEKTSNASTNSAAAADNTRIESSASSTPAAVAQGVLDTSWDTDGIMVLSSGGGLDATNAGGAEGLHDLIIDSQDRIVFTGSWEGTSPGRSANVNGDYIVGRLTSAGALDTTFSSDGYDLVTSNSNNEWNYGFDVVEDSDGNIFTAGIHDHTTYAEGDGVTEGGSIYISSFISKMDSSGSYDNTFSGDGKAFYSFNRDNDYGRHLVIQPDGKIVLCGVTYLRANGGSNITNRGYVWYVARFDTDGSLDTTFADRGDGTEMWDSDGNGSNDADTSTTDAGILVLPNVVGGSWSSADARWASVTSCMLDSSGKIILAGYMGDNPGNSYRAAIARVNANGTLDTTFDTDGIFVLPNPFGATPNDYVWDASQDSSGNFILVGSALDASSKKQGAIWKVTAAGALDTTFNSTGYQTLKQVADGVSDADRVDELYAIEVDAAGNYVIAGRSRYNSSKYVGFVGRFTSAGVLDTTFNASGGTPGYVQGYDYNGGDDCLFYTIDTKGTQIVAGGRCTNASDRFQMTFVKLK